MATACYTPLYLPASFKGIAFDALVAESEHGRRGAEGEFPFGETTAYADLGRKIRVYKIKARLAENSHIADTAVLIAACEATGPGVLVHPTRGILTSVACRYAKVKDEVDEGQGVTYIEFEFVEANEITNGIALQGQLLGLALVPLLTAVRNAFTSNYQINGIQQFREDAVVGAAQLQVTNITTAYTSATVDLATDTGRNRAIDDLSTVASDDGTARDTDVMDQALSLGMNAIAQKLTASDKFNAFRALANKAAISSTFNAPAATAEDAVYSLVRITSAAYMAEATLESTDFRTGQIFSQADIVDQLLQSEMLFAQTSCQNHLYSALATFRGNAATQLANRAYNSPGLVEYDFGGQVHPLTAAYAVYGDAKRHRQLENLNIVGPLGRIASPVLGVA